MISQLNNDILEYLSYYLNISDISNLKKSCKEFKYIFNNDYFTQRAYQLYSKTFWHKAYSRTPILSKPLTNLENELLRIEKFNKKINELNLKKWEEKDFYEYWGNLEKHNNKKLCNPTIKNRIKNTIKNTIKNRIINKYLNHYRRN